MPAYEGRVVSIPWLHDVREGVLENFDKWDKYNAIENYCQWITLCDAFATPEDYPCVTGVADDWHCLVPIAVECKPTRFWPQMMHGP